jgi:hypothetical protein
MGDPVAHLPCANNANRADVHTCAPEFCPGTIGNRVEAGKPKGHIGHLPKIRSLAVGKGESLTLPLGVKNRVGDMAFAFQGAGALDYAPCQYAGSRLMFRGPERPVTGRYLACLGGTETYGRFVQHPFPDLLEAAIGLPVVNLGCANAGPDVYLAEDAILTLAAGAELAILQTGGLANLSNAFYSVHPRRNDRFLGATPRLRALFREVDFTEFAFTRHMLHGLIRASPRRFDQVLQELRQVWLRQMRAILARLEGRAVLLCLTDGRTTDAFHPDAALIEQLRPCCAALLHLPLPPDAPEPHGILPMDAPAARLLPGPDQHEAIMAALLPVIRNLA